MSALAWAIFLVGWVFMAEWQERRKPLTDDSTKFIAAVFVTGFIHLIIFSRWGR